MGKGGGGEASARAEVCMVGVGGEETFPGVLSGSEWGVVGDCGEESVPANQHSCGSQEGISQPESQGKDPSWIKAVVTELSRSAQQTDAAREPG